MPTFTLLMMYDDAYAALGAVTGQRARDYAERHGYGFQCVTRLLDPALHPHWNKVLMVRQSMNLASEWFVWLDADVYIWSLDFGLESLVRPDKDLLLSADSAGYCCGFYLVRKCTWSMRLFDALLFLQNVQDTGRRPLNDQDSLKLLIESYPAVASRCAGISDAIVQNPDSARKPAAFAHHFWANREHGRFDSILAQISQRSTSSCASPS